MSESPRDSSAEPAIVDIVGVGFGPANLALAIAVEEHNANCAAVDRVNARFSKSSLSSRGIPGCCSTVPPCRSRFRRTW